MRNLLALCMILVSVNFLFAQRDYDNELPPYNEDEFVGFDNTKKKKDRVKKDLSRIRIGGTAGFGFSNGLLNLTLSPLVGYQVVEDRLELGGGVNYDYLRFKNRSENYQQHTIGPVVYIRGYIWRGIFAQLRGVYLKSYAKQVSQIGNQSITQKAQGDFRNVFAAGGYSIPLGDRAFFNVGIEVNLIRYDLSQVNANNARVFQPFLNFQFSL